MRYGVEHLGKKPKDNTLAAEIDKSLELNALSRHDSAAARQAAVCDADSRTGKQLFTDIAIVNGADGADLTEQEKALYVYRYLLVFVACLESFAHGANDTANGTAAFAAVYNAYRFDLTELCGQANETPWWIMAIAGAFVALGVNTMGYRVIQTIGKDLTDLDFQMGFAIEFASTLTVVIATVLGLPVSSTHCQVGAVVFTGLVKPSGGKVEWALFGKIALSWVLTLPFAGGLAAGLTALFRAGLETHN